MPPMPHATRRLALLVLILALLPIPSFTELLWSDSGFFVDMPSGFELADGDGKTRFAFADPNGGMEFNILAYEAGRYASVDALAADVAKKLASSGEVEGFSYEGRKAVLAGLSFAMNGQAMKGYAIFIGGRSGSATQRERSYALLAYAPEASFSPYADFVLSCLDSFAIDRAARRTPGPLSQYLLEWPPTAGSATKKVKLPGGRVAELPWNPAEAEQEAGTDGREYRVLMSYKDTEDLWIEAWARYYRMIFRESAARLDRLVLELARSLPAKDPTESSRRLLAWVQGFVYERDEAGTDFVPPLIAAYEGRGDCDSRAVVMAAILERIGVDAILMVSPAYAHAMIGVDVPGGGQRFAFNGKEYLVGETTDESGAGIGIGKIAANQADWSKWMGIDLGQ